MIPAALRELHVAQPLLLFALAIVPLLGAAAWYEARRRAATEDRKSTRLNSSH